MHTYRQTHKVTDATDHPTHAGMDNNNHGSVLLDVKCVLSVQILPMYSNSSRRAMPLCDQHSVQMRANRFCGPSPMKYSISRSNSDLSRGRIGHGNGGPGGGGLATLTPVQSECIIVADQITYTSYLQQFHCWKSIWYANVTQWQSLRENFLTVA